MKQLVLSLAILAATAAQTSAEIRSVSIEDIVIRYDDAHFVISHDWPADVGGAQDGGYPIKLVFRCGATIRCLGDPFLIVTAAPVRDGERTLLSLLDPDPDDRDRIRPLWAQDDDPMRYGLSSSRDFGGLTLTGTIRHSRCRSRAPSEIDAAGVYGGILYRFASGSTYLCGGVEGFSPEMFRELLSGITVIDEQQP